MVVVIVVVCGRDGTSTVDPWYEDCVVIVWVDVGVCVLGGGGGHRCLLCRR